MSLHSPRMLGRAAETPTGRGTREAQPVLSWLSRVAAKVELAAAIEEQREHTNARAKDERADDEEAEK
jgi:hypothetical protein